MFHLYISSLFYIGANPDPDGANPDPDGANPDPDGANPDPDGANHDPDGANPDPDGANPDPDGANPDPDGANPDPDGANHDPDGANHDPVGPADNVSITQSKLFSLFLSELLCHVERCLKGHLWHCWSLASNTRERCETDQVFYE